MGYAEVVLDLTKKTNSVGLMLIEFTEFSRGWNLIFQTPLKQGAGKNTSKVCKSVFMPKIFDRPGWFIGQTRQYGSFSVEGRMFLPKVNSHYGEDNRLVDRYRMNPNYVPKESEAPYIKAGEGDKTKVKINHHIRGQVTDFMPIKKEMSFNLIYVWTHVGWVPAAVHEQRTKLNSLYYQRAIMRRNTRIKKEIKKASKKNIFEILKKYTIKTTPVKETVTEIVPTISGDRAGTSHCFTMEMGGRGKVKTKEQVWKTKIQNRLKAGTLNELQLQIAKERGWI